MKHLRLPLNTPALLKLGTTFAIVAASLGPLLLGLGGMMAFFGATTLVVTAIAALGIAATVAIGIDLASWANGGSSAFSKLAGGADKATGALAWFRDGILGIGTSFDKMFASGTSAWGRIGAFFEMIGNYAIAVWSGMFAALEPLATEAWDALVAKFKLGWEDIVASAKMIWTSFTDFLSIDLTPAWIKNIGSWFSGIGDWIAGDGPAKPSTYNGSRPTEAPFNGNLSGGLSGIMNLQRALPSSMPAPKAASGGLTVNSPMTVSITAAPGTTDEQARDISGQFQRMFDTNLRRAVAGAAYDFPTAEAPV